MHLRTTTVKRNGKTYQYAQLVESFRRDSDGMPSHRIVASLGNLAKLDLDNLRTALAASRAGEQVLVATAGPIPKPTSNLRYLDLAVMLELWREWRLDELLQSLLPASEAEVAVSKIVCALTLQRCIDPGSKLAATRWVPRTALPELLAFSSAAFNNTRVHRALELLEEATPTLMTSLAHRYQDAEGAFATLFVDTTDTWFVGHGPALAQCGKTKEGMLQRKIGIVLLCNERGYPLRWDVVEGCAPDCRTIGAMLRSIAGLPWAKSVPVVCDRAMGKTEQVRQLLDSDLHFVTALTTPEFDAYVPQLPCGALNDFDPDASAAHDPAARAAALAEARRRVIAAGLSLEEDDLLVRDFGVVERLDDGFADETAPGTATDQDATIAALQHCRALDEDLALGRSVLAAARLRGLTKGQATKYRGLRSLSQDLQRRTLDGALKGHSLAQLLRIAKIPVAEQQQQAFDTLSRTAPAAGAQRRAGSPSSSLDTSPRAPVRVRAVVYFNPVRFVDQRLHARTQLARVDAFVAALNLRLAAPHSRMKPPQITAAMDRELRRDDLLDAYSYAVVNDTVAGRTTHRVSHTLVDAQWARRRRADGFSIVVAHPDLVRGAATLCRLYREKDTVEKDFQTIKTVLELRPVRHREESKIRAHVTLCMLALLLERTLQHKLRGLHSPREALELLAPLHLNHYQQTADAKGAYVLTQADAAQAAILRRLALQRLVLDREVADRLTPR